MPAHLVTKEQAEAFLAAKFGSLADIEQLSGGFWSSAFSFSLNGRALVIRFGSHPEWFETERRAMSFASRDLPVPEVLEIGEEFNGVYVISVRHFGITLESIRPDQRDVAGPMLTALLGALFRIPKDPSLPVDWQAASPVPELTWRRWLAECLVEEKDGHDFEWKAPLVRERAAYEQFNVVVDLVTSLIPRCPERRDLIHGDLLNANVLVTPDAQHPTAVFSWKCSVRGDFVYDVAWCTFWAPWHPGIAVLNPLGDLPLISEVREDEQALTDLAIRHHCYELLIGASHLGWNALQGDREELYRVVDRVRDVIARGPVDVGTM